MGRRTIETRVRNDIDIEGTIVFSVRLSRGGAGWLSYDNPKLSSELRQEWDALEGILLALAENRHLHVLGHFDGTPVPGKCVPVRKKRKHWLGSYEVTPRDDLHELLNANPTGPFTYVVSSIELTPYIIRAAIQSRSEAEFYGWYLTAPGAYCCFDEPWDLNYIDCGCSTNDLDAVTGTMATVLPRFGLELQPVNPDGPGNSARQWRRRRDGPGGRGCAR